MYLGIGGEGNEKGEKVRFTTGEVCKPHLHGGKINKIN